MRRKKLFRDRICPKCKKIQVVWVCAPSAGRSQMKSHQRQQSTHWYRPRTGTGHTADPRQAAPGELVRVGFHDCKALGCKEIHACSFQDYHGISFGSGKKKLRIAAKKKKPRLRITR